MKRKITKMIVLLFAVMMVATIPVAAETSSYNWSFASGSGTGSKTCLAAKSRNKQYATVSVTSGNISGSNKFYVRIYHGATAISAGKHLAKKDSFTFNYNKTAYTDWTVKMVGQKSSQSSSDNSLSVKGTFEP